MIADYYILRCVFNAIIKWNFIVILEKAVESATSKIRVLEMLGFFEFFCGSNTYHDDDKKIQKNLADTEPSLCRGIFFFFLG